jgi:hypothetical protein
MRRIARVLALMVCIWLIDQGHELTAAPPPRPAIREFTSDITLRGQTLTLHFAIPSVPVSPGTPLVLYASGDGGWFGAAVSMFRTLARSGYPVVGISSRSFMHIERKKSTPLTVAEVVAGYQQIIDAARARVPSQADAPVVLTGWSRGAALGVLVASSADIDSRVIGLVAIGVAADEQLDIDYDSDDDSGAVAPSDHQNSRDRAIAMYPLIARITGRRTVVIQASHDGYLSAARARELFGPDTPVRRLLPIEARNHRFDGGQHAFTAALAEALEWVSRREDGAR